MLVSRMNEPISSCLVPLPAVPACRHTTPLGFLGPLSVSDKSVDTTVRGANTNHQLRCGDHTGNWCIVNYVTVRYILSHMALIVYDAHDNERDSCQKKSGRP
jgi:hypothetical protein